MLCGQLGIISNHHIKIERLSHFHYLKSYSDAECLILLSSRALKFVWIFFDLLHEPAHHHGGEHYIVFQVEADQHLKLDVIQNPANFLSLYCLLSIPRGIQYIQGVFFHWSHP